MPKRKFNELDAELTYYQHKFSPKIKGLIKEINKQDVTIDTIDKLDLDDKETMWFIENIDIKDHIPLHTEERYLMKTKIYDRLKRAEKKLKIIDTIEIDLQDKIIQSKHSDDIKNILHKKYNKLQSSDSSDSYKINDWIEHVLELPTEIVEINKSNITNQIFKLMECLNEKIFGLDHVKEQIIETFCAIATNNNYKKNVIALAGPPGVGKTAIASTIARAMNLPFEQISMGCVKDVNSLVGMCSTYIGSKPGIFVELLKKMKKKNGVILLDELDKVSHSSESNSIISTLLHVLDKTQNNTFRDYYMPEINIDLSGIFFIVALNDIKLIDPILRDRLSIINIEGYDIKEKIKIGTKYILPKVLSELDFNDEEIIINDKEMEYIIKQSGNEHGVRSMEKAVRKICERINVLRFMQQNRSKKKIKLSYNITKFELPIVITQEHIDNLKKN